jgi:uncharacterized LabA/DUF88 family protein
LRVAIYIDGFAFYYACFAGPTKVEYARWKWIDLQVLAESLFPSDEISAIHYFTAIAPSPPDDQDQSSRHATYLDALRTRPLVTTHIGRFVKSKRHVSLVHPPLGINPHQTAHIWQEKQSDVALAVQMLGDAVQGVADTLVLVTNDSDFVPAVRAVRSLSHVDVGIISPDKTISGELARVADFANILDKGLLAISQLPNPVMTSQGRAIHKPSSWEGDRG